MLVLLPGGPGDRRTRIDPLPALLAVTALGSTVSMMHGTLSHGWVSSETAGWLLVAAVSGATTVWTSRRSSAPLLPGSLLRDRAVVVADLSGALVGAALLGTFYFVSLHLQQVLGYSPMQAGWTYLPLVGGLVLAAGIGSAALPRFGARPILVLGLAGCSKGLLLLAWLGIDSERSSFWTSLLPGLLVTGLGLGLAFVALTATAIPGEGTDGESTASGAAKRPVQHRAPGRRRPRDRRAGHGRDRTDRRHAHSGSLRSAGRDDGSRPGTRRGRGHPPRRCGTGAADARRGRPLDRDGQRD